MQVTDVKLVSRQGEVSALTSAEQERAMQAVQLGQGYCKAALSLIAQQGPSACARLRQLAQLMLKVLDGFVMPGDLVGSRQDLQEAVVPRPSSESVSIAAEITPQASR